ncbi:MAG: Ig-like domain-containing protein [Candidatus Sulfotelmatobacter sp.]
MSSAKHKLCLASALCALAIVVFELGCTGFFVNPTLSSIVVGPASPTIATGSTDNTVQMTVFGTNNDGSTTNNVPVAWSISDQTVATINPTGLVTSVGLGTATVTATANANPSITGTQTVTVTVPCITAITLTPTSGTVSNNLPTVSITANATTCNGPQNVTSVATWTSSNTSLATVSAGVVSIATGLTTGQGGTVSITATIGNIVSSPAANITVSP